jgi:hypothetical protein
MGSYAIEDRYLRHSVGRHSRFGIMKQLWEQPHAFLGPAANRP